MAVPDNPPPTKEADLPTYSSQDELENAPTANNAAVDKLTERKLMAKLDKRIVPMVMWMFVDLSSPALSQIL